MKKVFLFLLMVLLVQLSNFVYGAIPAEERAALIAFYNSTNGDGWSNRTGWKTPPLHTDGFALPGTEGNWLGVKVSGDHVTHIFHFYNNLNGSIPSELENLIYLEHLDLSSNKLNGTIPIQLGNLTHLHLLDLSANKLSGNIPTQLGNLVNLQKLHLDTNQLSGNIPSQLANLTKLLELSLFNNQLSGSIPTQLENLTYLENLTLSSNQLTGGIPPQLGNLTNLITLSLSENPLGGSIPYQLGNLIKLDFLGLSSNQLSGTIPPQLAGIANLRVLNLSSNQLTGSIPPQLSNLTHLQYLYLQFNQLNNSIPSELGSLTNLQLINLSGNQFSGSIPTELGNLMNLVYLYLQGNELSGSIPFQLGNLSNLIVLNLGSNHISGNIPSELGNLTKLQYLAMNANQLTGSVPEQIGNLVKLQYLNLNSNLLSGSIPESIKKLLHIYNLDIGYNCFAVTNPSVRAWLTQTDPDWEIHQDQCSGDVQKPTILTGSVTSINSNSAVCGGNVTSDGGITVTARGVCWSTTPNPTVNSSKTTDGTGTGSFSSSITGLQPGMTYHVRAYATNNKGTSYGSDVSFTASGTPQITLNRNTLNFGAATSGNNPDPQSIIISNTGGGTLNWNTSSNANWLTVSPTSGTGDSIVSVSVNPTGLAAGNYEGILTFKDINAANSPQTLTVNLKVYEQGKTSVPFGEFATPSEGSSVSNSVPITGWALDDVGIASVKIYCNDSYIGDTVFIDGSRPDVEAAYPGYPNNTKAGWGYMLLTHFLPNGGNGTYTITAKATDTEGNVVTLGSKTIEIDNAHAIKPFGAIDTPEQGGTVSGNSYVNFGWVLTPLPAEVPTDGSTIEVIIDGVVQGHAGYNSSRSDIASLFPGFNNTNGAGGYFYIDTTKLKNGLHTIAWNVTDNNGNSDGIGSRYFSVMNTGTGSDLARSSVSPLSNDSKVAQAGTSMNKCDIEKIEIKELERLEIRFAELPNAPTHHLSGYLVIQNQLRECPVGSTLDKDNGIFYWQPGPGFVGEYRFIFTGEDENGQNVQKSIIVNIKSKY